MKSKLYIQFFFLVILLNRTAFVISYHHLMDSMDDASGNPGSSGLVSKNYTEEEVNTTVSELEKVTKFSKTVGRNR